MKMGLAVRTGHQYSNGCSKAVGKLKHQQVPKLRDVKQQESELVREFKQAVRKRPTDVAWLISYGNLARSMGLTYPEALAVVKPHTRRLRGNTRHIWIDQGLKSGYNLLGLSA